MGRLLLVSGNPGLRMAIGAAYDVVEERPTRAWRLDVERLTEFAAVLLDLHDPVRAGDVAGQILGSGFDGPVIVFAAGDGHWHEVTELLSEQVQVLELPLKGSALTSALSRFDPGPRPSRRAILRHESHPVNLPVNLPEPRPATAPRTWTASEPDAPATERPETPAAISRQAVSTSGDGIAAAVRALAARLGDLRGLADAADALVGDATAATRSEAGAVLVRDGHHWRLTAGREVRHLEWRLAVDEESWLVEQAVNQRHGIVVEDTDIARQRLAGVPLASWPQLMVAPVADTDTIVLVARHEGAYGEEGLVALRKAATRHAGDLDDARRLRDLARALQPYAGLGGNDERRS